KDFLKVGGWVRGAISIPQERLIWQGPLRGYINRLRYSEEVMRLIRGRGGQKQPVDARRSRQTGGWPSNASCGPTMVNRHEPSCVHGTHTGPREGRNQPASIFEGKQTTFARSELFRF